MKNKKRYIKPCLANAIFSYERLTVAADAPFQAVKPFFSIFWSVNKNFLNSECTYDTHSYRFLK